MRALLVLMLLVSASGAARADWLFWRHQAPKPKAQQPAPQVKQEKRVDQILNPDPAREYDVRESTFSDSDRKAASKSATVKPYLGVQKFEAKSFSTSAFWGTKSSSMKDEKFATSSAPTKGLYEIPNVSKKEPTKAVPVMAERDANKTMPVRAAADANRSFYGRGRSQDRFDAEKGTPEKNGLSTVGYNGDLKPLTIDDIRDLLNKSK